MKIIILSFVVASIIFLIIDVIWLSFAVKNFYKPNLAGIPMNDNPNLLAGITFYFLYTSFELTLKNFLSRVSVLQIGQLTAQSWRQQVVQHL